MSFHHSFHYCVLVYEGEMCVHLPSDAFRCLAWHIEVQFHAFVGSDFWNFFHGKFLNFHGNLLRRRCRRG